MSHVAISLYAAAFITGILAAFYTIQIKKKHLFLYLRSLAHFVLAFNLLILILVVSNYVKTNLQIESPGELPLVFWICDCLVNYLAAIGMTYSFLRVVQGLAGLRVSFWAKALFSAGSIILAFSYGAGLALYVQNQDFRLFFGTRNASYLAIILIPIISSIILLFRTIKIENVDRNKLISPFCVFYLAGFGLLFLSMYIVFQFTILVVGTLLLYINVIPFIWLKWIFLKIYGDEQSHTGTIIALDKITAENRISAREREILELILQGKSNKEIEELLFISLSTVKNHIYNIYQKLNVKSRGQLMHFVMEAQKRR